MAGAVTYPAIDADGHIRERRKDVQRYLASPWDRRGGGIHPGDEPYDTFLGGQIKQPYGYTADMSPEVQVDIWHRALEEHGMEQAVLFPTGSHSMVKLRDIEYTVAIARAANTLLAKEFTSPRLHPMGVLPLRDPVAAVRELKYAVEELGLIGFELTTNGFPAALGDPIYHPIYAAAEKLGAKICIHGTRHWAHEHGAGGLRTFGEIHAYSFPAGIMLQFTSVICQGIPQLFPELNLGFLETGATWLPYYLHRLDEHWEKRGAVEMPNLPRRPSELFRESKVKLSIESSEPLLPETLAYAGAEHFFYATDIPHWDCEFPGNLNALRASTILSEDVKRKLLYQNAMDFYGLKPMPQAKQRTEAAAE
jgi:predicted TIM-barrel fold metal-dependent hydrolase